MKDKTRRSPLFRASRWLSALVLSALILGSGAAQAAEPRPAAGPQARVQDAAQGVVNINTATEEQLGRLPGIGPSKARAIIELRKRMGKFERVESLLRVRGIGRKTLKKLRPMLVVKGETTLQPSKRGKKAK
jgi:competence protein ComEA